MNYKLLDDNDYKIVISNNTNPITTPSISNGYIVCDGGIYDKFMDSLDEVKDCKLLMTHLPLDIRLTRIVFEGYLTEEELQEKQYEGRFWDLCGGYLYILVDDDTVVVIEPDNNKDVHIYGRDHLPQSLVGRHYYDA